MNDFSEFYRSIAEMERGANRQNRRSRRASGPVDMRSAVGQLIDQSAPVTTRHPAPRYEDLSRLQNDQQAQNEADLAQAVRDQQDNAVPFGMGHVVRPIVNAVADPDRRASLGRAAQRVGEWALSDQPVIPTEWIDAITPGNVRAAVAAAPSAVSNAVTSAPRRVGDAIEAAPNAMGQLYDALPPMAPTLGGIGRAITYGPFADERTLQHDLDVARGRGDTAHVPSLADEANVQTGWAGLNAAFVPGDSMALAAGIRRLGARGAAEAAPEASRVYRPAPQTKVTVEPDGRVSMTYQGGYEAGASNPGALGSGQEAVRTWRGTLRALEDDIVATQRPEYHWTPGPDGAPDARLADFYRNALSRRAPEGYVFSETPDGVMHLTRSDAAAASPRRLGEPAPTETPPAEPPQASSGTGDARNVGAPREVLSGNVLQPSPLDDMLRRLNIDPARFPYENRREIEYNLRLHGNGQEAEAWLERYLMNDSDRFGGGEIPTFPLPREQAAPEPLRLTNVTPQASPDASHARPVQASDGNAASGRIGEAESAPNPLREDDTPRALGQRPPLLDRPAGTGEDLQPGGIYGAGGRRPRVGAHAGDNPVSNVNAAPERGANAPGTEADFLQALPTDPEQWRSAVGAHPWINSPSRARLVIMASARDASGRFVYSTDDIINATGYGVNSENGGNVVRATIAQARDAGVPIPRRHRGILPATAAPGGDRLDGIIRIMERAERNGEYVSSRQIADMLGTNAANIDVIRAQVRNNSVPTRRVPEEVRQRFLALDAAQSARSTQSTRTRQGIAARLRRGSDTASAAAIGAGIGAGLTATNARADTGDGGAQNDWPTIVGGGIGGAILGGLLARGHLGRGGARIGESVPEVRAAAGSINQETYDAVRSSIASMDGPELEDLARTFGVDPNAVDRAHQIATRIAGDPEAVSAYAAAPGPRMSQAEYIASVRQSVDDLAHTGEFDAVAQRWGVDPDALDAPEQLTRAYLRSAPSPEAAAFMEQASNAASAQFERLPPQQRLQVADQLGVDASAPDFAQQAGDHFTRPIHDADRGRLNAIAGPLAVGGAGAGLLLSGGEARAQGQENQIRPLPEGMDFREGNWLEPQWRQITLPDGSPGVERAILGPDRQPHIIVARQGADASITVLGEVSPSAGPPPPSAPRVGNHMEVQANSDNAPTPRGPSYAASDSGGVPRVLGALVAGQLTRGLGRRLGAGPAARELWGIGGTYAGGRALGLDNEDALLTSAGAPLVGLGGDYLAGRVSRLGGDVYTGLHNGVTAQMTDQALLSDPRFLARRRAFMQTLPEEMPRARVSAGSDLEMGAFTDQPANIEMDGRGNIVSGLSPYSEFAAASPTEQAVWMDRQGFEIPQDANPYQRRLGAPPPALPAPTEEGRGMPPMNRRTRGERTGPAVQRRAATRPAGQTMAGFIDAAARAGFTIQRGRSNAETARNIANAVRGNPRLEQLARDWGLSVLLAAGIGAGAASETRAEVPN